jgi:hypothetical protein
MKSFADQSIFEVHEDYVGTGNLYSYFCSYCYFYSFYCYCYYFDLLLDDPIFKKEKVLNLYINFISMNSIMLYLLK